MKRWKKIVLLIFSFNILFFTVDSKKREAEAFAVSTAAMVLGGLAIVGVGATLLSRQNAQNLGSSIISNLGDAYSDVVNFNTVTETGRIVMSPAMRIAMNKAIGDRKSSVASHKAVAEVPYVDVGSGRNNTGVRVSYGDSVQISFAYQAVENYTGTSYVFFEDVNRKNLIRSVGISGASGFFDEVYSVNSLQAVNSLLYLSIMLNNHGRHHAISNVTVTNLSTVNTPEAIEYRQYENIPSDSTERLNLINNTVTQNEYVIDGSNIKEGVSSISQLEQKLDEIGDSQLETNITIGKIFGALGNMPAAIATGIGNAFGWLQGLLTNIRDSILGIPASVAGAMSGLWEDAGLVWSGIKDTTVATNNWLNNVLTGALDGISSGIDNLSRGLSDTWEGIEAGLANIADKIGAGVSTGVTDLTGVIDKIGSIPMDLIGLIIPSDWSGITEKVDSLMFNVAENPFKEFMDSLSAVFAKRKSIFDLRITLYGKVYPIVPLVLKPALDTARTFLTGAVMLVSLTLVYVRAKGISWWK